MAAEPFVTMELDGIAFELREPHDFAWLRRLGRVFRVFDRQDSGNICIGVRSGSRRLFIKYAGARKVDYDGATADAVARLRQAVLSTRL